MKSDIIFYINERFKDINPLLKIEYSNEDYCEQDLEEYGIDDIDDTAHYKVLFYAEDGYSATVLNQIYDIESLKLNHFNSQEFKDFNLNSVEVFSIIKDSIKRR